MQCNYFLFNYFIQRSLVQMCNLRVMPIYGASTLIAQFGLRTRLAFKYGYYYARFSSSYVARRELKLTLNESEKYLRTFFIFYRLRMNEFYFQISCIFDRTFGSLMHAACKYVSMVFMCFYVLYMISTINVYTVCGITIALYQEYSNWLFNQLFYTCVHLRAHCA